jgi:hypothetical protein
MFAPPFGPPDLARCASCLHDDPLIGGTECPAEAAQRGLDEPRFEGHACSLAVEIEFPGKATQRPGIKLFARTKCVESTGFRTSGTYRMGQAQRPTCPHCGAFLILALPPSGKGQQTFQCFDCDGPDPLKTDKATGWLKGELQPPK